ncbi:MAG TPA: DinB family protein [Candidatus Xenobia bacterium]|nr:DinB family protein [Candidatus Xenobia bacterium]
MANVIDELSVIREHLERYRGVTLQTLEMVPEDKLPWYPSVAQFSFAQQFYHIAQVEEFYSRGLFEGDWNTARLEPPRQRFTRDELRAKLKEARAYTLGRLDKLTPAQLEATVRVPNIPVEWPLRSWLWYMLEHEIHHKAQLAVYLRHIDVTPPFFAFVLPPGVRPDIR